MKWVLHKLNDKKIALLDNNKVIAMLSDSYAKENQLIAAAPEMLEVIATIYTLANLESLLKTKYSAPLVQDLMRMMEQAIAKAEGK